MAKKLPGRRDAGNLVRTSVPTVIPKQHRETLFRGGMDVAHGTLQAGAYVTSTAVTAAGQVLEVSIQTFGECFIAFMGYLREREITTRVVAQERAATARVQAWSDAVIAEAEARTEEVRIQAGLVLAAIEDRRNQRESKVAVVRGFMEAYQRWNDMLSNALARRADRMPLDQRELLQQHIETLLRRARDMEYAITSIAHTL